MKFSALLNPALTAALMLASAAQASAQEAPAPAAAYTPEPAAPAATPAPAAPTDAERLQALEQQLAAQRKELEAMQAERTESVVTDPNAEADHPKLRLYGFADVGGQWIGMKKGPYTDFIASAPAFALGNVNLYFDARPSPAWRALVETRFGLGPQGSWNGLTQVDNRFMDTSSPSGRTYAIWSGVILERAWLQWTYSEHFALQAGYLLTPYGIWNVDHGTPTLISLVLPSLQVEEAIPQHQIGVQALGTFARQEWELGYHAYLTNGRDVNPSERNWHEGVGGRLVLRRYGDLRLALGTSGYYGTFSKDVLLLHVGVDPVTGASTVTFEKSDWAKDGGYAAQEWSAGGDVSADWNGFRFRGEAMVQRVVFDDGKHEHQTFGDPTAMIPNHYSHYAYAILAYRFASYYEPYLFVDYTDKYPQISINKLGICYSGGLNLYFTASAMLKLQYANQRFSPAAGAVMNMQLAAVRLVLVF